MKVFVGRLTIAFISLILSFLSFGFFEEVARIWIKSQIGIIFLAVLSVFSLVAILTVISLLIFSKLFGRWYCSLICPLGILQDFILLLRGDSVGSCKNWKRTRYVLTFFLLFSVTLGMTTLFGFFEPFTLFGKIAGVGNVAVLMHEGTKVSDWYLQRILIVSISVFFVFTILVLWKGRSFCTVFCPVGTILGVFSKQAKFQLKISKNVCVKCGKCKKNCPAGCLDINEKEIDYERCLLCMRCLTSCKFSAIKYGKVKKKNCLEKKDENEIIENEEKYLKKREFLLMLLGFSGIAIGFSLRKKENLYNLNSFAEEQNIILPPGAGSASRFFSTCTGCQLCVANCTGKVLKPYKTKVKFEITPDTMCSFECNKCGQVCPSGAIMPLTLEEKKQRRVGVVDYQSDLCIAVKNGYDCGACAEHCPVGALQMVENLGGVRVPKVFIDVCIGCGNCEQICPVVPAVKVYAVPIQVNVPSPQEFFKDEKTVPVENSGEWAF